MEQQVKLGRAKLPTEHSLLPEMQIKDYQYILNIHASQLHVLKQFLRLVAPNKSSPERTSLSNLLAGHLLALPRFNRIYCSIHQSCSPVGLWM
jgi:hypothetical protein